MLTGFLEELGLFVGHKQLPFDLHEATFFVQLNEWILYQANASWDNIYNYQFVDESPRLGNNYYRIKAINLNDGNVYSHSEYLRFDDMLGLNVFVFPNPTIDEINVELVGEAMVVYW